MDNNNHNAALLEKEFVWLHQVIQARFELYFNKGNTQYENIFDVGLPELKETQSVYAEVVGHYQMNFFERAVLLLALAPHVCPQLLDVFFMKNEKYNRGFTEFGGVKGVNFSGFLPTGETAIFILTGNDMAMRFQVMELFSENHFFHKFNFLSLDNNNPKEPILSGLLSISKEYLHYLTLGTTYEPRFSTDFPAQKLFTKLDWNDLVLNKETIHDVNEIITWIKHQHVIMDDWGLQKHLKPGYRCLFYGPPGTGKTLTASLIGKSAKLNVYRIDLSKVVSKYIGETEKNLAKIFDQAENKNWILFFDEADALFGKRTSASDAKDRYANQEIAYLLQRIEDFAGVIILASNLKGNIDAAFSRRFQNITYFPMPKPRQRLLLWQKAFTRFNLDEDVSLDKIAKDYEIAGGGIINVLRFCALEAVNRNITDRIIYLDDIKEGVRREFRKEGKTI